MSDNELLHWGIKGMKWGRRRYQNKDGSLTPEGKKRYGDGEQSAEDYATAKAKAIKSGSAADVLKYKGDLTQQEMQSIENRLRWEHNMADTAAKDAAAAKGKSTIDKMAEKADKITKNSESFIKLYNTGANLVNAFSDLDVQLPKVETNVTNGNRAQRKAEKKRAKEATKEEKQQDKKETKDAKEVKPNKPNQKSDIIDVTPVSEVKNSNVAKSGEAAINSLLELPAPKDDDR